LSFSEEELAQRGAMGFGEADYPSELELRGARFPLKYRFAPGEPDDGVSIRVPVGALQAVVGEALEWSVPGFFPLACEQWLKSLPKSKRKQLAPVPDKVQEMVPLLLRPERYRQGRLPVALAQVVQDLFAVRIEAGDWDRERLDPHLLMNVQVVDGDDRVLAQGRNLETLKEQFASQVRSRVEQGAAAALERSDITRFPDDLTLADTMVLEDEGGKVVAYPALVDRGDHVDVRLLATEAEQQRARPRGYARLALLHLGQTARYLKKRAEGERELGLHFAPLGTARELYDELLRGAVWYCCFAERPLPRTAAAFDERIQTCKGKLAEQFEATLAQLRLVLAKRFEVARLMRSLSSPAFAEALADAQGQLERLVPADVLAVTPQRYLAEIPRYLDALGYRLQHLQGRVQKDRELCGVVHGFETRLERLRRAAGLLEADFQRLRFAVEELRIGLFAEPLGTRGKVSAKRLNGDFLQLERELGLV
ncbi:MAG: DUF3418 domain-containing protein, partial [Pseudomonadales bacterium]